MKIIKQKSPQVGLFFLYLLLSNSIKLKKYIIYLILIFFMLQSKKETVYIILAGIFITNAVVAELIGGKLIHVGPTYERGYLAHRICHY
jgi:hypothetical protein